MIPRPFKIFAGRLALAVLTPLLLLAGVEMALRGLDLGYPADFLLHVTVRGRDALVDNPFYGYRFFTPVLARNPAPIVTSSEKAPDTIRVVVLGESAAQGDPLMEFGLPRMLETVLNEGAAGQRFEVINAAMTAINSTVITDIARGITACRPDVVLLYIGNNEVIGPYGPGTVFTALPGLLRLAPWRVTLTRLKILFFLREGLGALGRRGRPPAAWSGLAMFAERPVSSDDPALAALYDLFEHNIRKIALTARRAGARVILSTVAVNLSDCPPFGGPAAAAEFERAGGLPRGEARAAFKRARDLDVYRFRADGVLNQRLRKLASELHAPLVDAEQSFDEAWAGGASDADFFVDHVHFTFKGTHRLARACADAVAELYPDLFPRRAWPDAAQCRQQLFYTPWSERQMAFIMLDRRRAPPFNRQPTTARRFNDDWRRFNN